MTKEQREELKNRFQKMMGDIEILKGDGYIYTGEENGYILDFIESEVEKAKKKRQFTKDELDYIDAAVDYYTADDSPIGERILRKVAKLKV